MKDCVILGGREFSSARKIEQDLGIDHKTRNKWIKAGNLPPPVRLGNRMYFDRAALEARILETAMEFCELPRVVTVELHGALGTKGLQCESISSRKR
jgi:predicted DNA-binding transcriptional regulator AlpA